MPLFRLGPGRRDLKPVEQTNFRTEKELQTLIETNLRTIFDCRLVLRQAYSG